MRAVAALATSERLFAGAKPPAPLNVRSAVPLLDTIALCPVSSVAVAPPSIVSAPLGVIVSNPAPMFFTRISKVEPSVADADMANPMADPELAMIVLPVSAASTV